MVGPFPSAGGRLRRAAHNREQSKADQPLSGTGGLPSTATWHERLRDLAARVERNGAGVLEGNSLNLSEFERLGPLVVRAGLIESSVVEYVLNGIRYGFDLGVDESKLQGKRVFRNYKSAFENSELVSDALRKRVQRGKTLKLGAFDGDRDSVTLELLCRMAP